MVPGFPLPTAKRLPQGVVSRAYPSFVDWDYEAKRRGAVRLRGAAAGGISYERKVEALLGRELPGLLCVNSLPHNFLDAVRWKRCIPDFLVLHPRQQWLCVVEVKLRHTGAAEAELEHLYVPVVQRAWVGWRIQQLEICRWYEPGLDKTPLIKRLRDFVFAEHMPRKGVYVWGGRR